MYKMIRQKLEKLQNSNDIRRCMLCNNILSIYNPNEECFHHSHKKDHDPQKFENSIKCGINIKLMLNGNCSDYLN